MRDPPGAKNEGISEVVTGVLRQSSPGLSKMEAGGKGEGRQSTLFEKDSKLTKLKDTVGSAMAGNGSIPSIIMVSKFSSSSLVLSEAGEGGVSCTGVLGCDDP